MISNLSKEAWDAKVTELGGSILQSWAWGEFQHSLGQKIYRFSSGDFASLAIETPLSVGKKFVYCPRGPLGNLEAALEDFRRLANDRNIIFSRFEPLQPMDLPRAVKETQPTNNWVLNLEKTEEEILMGMKPKTRYNINLAKRKGVVIREGDQTDLIKIWQMFLETAERNQIRLHAQNYYFQMWDYLHPNHLRTLIAEYKGQILSGMILTLFADTATYLHGGSSVKFKEAMAPYLLHFEAIRLTKNLGMKSYDFGGVASSNDLKHSWAGISRFKKSFGGNEVIYPGSFDLIYSPIWYNVYKQARLARKLFRNS
jgi:lipid II:glycine glycyltransferase (peptidoglycan interpeptide bridge formation enzyme)